MKLRRVTALILAAVILACLGYTAYRKHHEKYVYLDKVRYERAAQAVDLSGRNLTELEKLKGFHDPQELDLRGTCISAEDYQQVKSWFPEARILWDIPFQGTYYPMDTRELTVTSMTDADMAALGYFGELEAVRAETCPDYTNMHKLRLENPDMQITYTIPAAGEWYSWDTKQLVLPGAEAAALLEVLPFFPELETVELTAPMGPAEDVMALLDALPQVSFGWNLEVGGIEVNEKTETLDLTGIPMTVEQMDALLPFLLNLTYVDMTDCGISNEEMDALNRRYEDIKIVWTVNIGRYMRVKTDEIYFMPTKWRCWVDTEDVYNLRYCTDMICVDIGHMPVENCEWARYMPKLKYLVISDTPISDLSPIAGLEELIFLEFFLTDVTDYSPMLECPALQDINMYYTRGDPEIIKQLTWVKNVWWRTSKLTYIQQKELQEALPNTHFEFYAYGSTDRGWRKLQNYYDHRDLMGMFYMN